MNNIQVNNRSFEVWMQDGYRGANTIACIYEVVNGKKGEIPLIGTSFGETASFERQVMPWARRALDRYFYEIEECK